MSASEQAVLNAQYNAAIEQGRPSAIFRPTLFPDGDMWCMLYGADIMTGVCGFGKTPSEAAYAFDKAWTEQKVAWAISKAQEPSS
jgi:hypothetical protein